eukprot:5117061-Pleurochrysis_carterae.AAC.1
MSPPPTTHAVRDFVHLLRICVRSCRATRALPSTYPETRPSNRPRTLGAQFSSESRRRSSPQLQQMIDYLSREMKLPSRYVPFSILVQLMMFDEARRLLQAPGRRGVLTKCLSASL